MTQILRETVRQFLSKQRELVGKTEWPPGTKFECRQCGECCKWNFTMLKIDEELNEKLRSLVKYPHGSWDLMDENKLRLAMPGISFIGLIPPNHTEFLKITGRTWGYWVLNEKGKIILYCPTTCIHLKDDGLCAIYEKGRPQVCNPYFCKRYPIQLHSSDT